MAAKCPRGSCEAPGGAACNHGQGQPAVTPFVHRRPSSAPTGQAGLLLALVFLWRPPGWAGVLTVQLGCLGMGRPVPRGLPASGTHSDGGVPGQDSPWAESLQVALAGLARMFGLVLL